MIYLTSNLHKRSVAINPKLVTYVTDVNGGGCILHFTDGKSIHVLDDYMEVVGKLMSESV